VRGKDISGGLNYRYLIFELTLLTEWNTIYQMAVLLSLEVNGKRGEVMSNSKEQSYHSHTRISPIYHYVLAPVSLIFFVASIVYIIMERFSFSSTLLLGLSVSVAILTILVRGLAITLQNRVIRNEENTRHFMLTGKPLDQRLTLQQIIALRFSMDEAFPSLCTKAADSGMEPDAIKRAIIDWRADHLRV
jgi:low affinity Fe/Cu permease